MVLAFLFEMTEDRRNRRLFLSTRKTTAHFNFCIDWMYTYM